MKSGRRNLFLLAAVSGVVLFSFAAQSRAASDANKPVVVDLYVMSHCPYGTQAENFIIPSVKSLGSSAELKIHFIADEVPAAAPTADNKTPKPTFTSMHGPEEVAEDLRHVCAMKHFPKQAMDFILARSANIKDPDWQTAAKKAGIDFAAIDACATGEEGPKLLSENIKASTTRQIHSSPTIFVNELLYSDPRSVRAMTMKICGILKDNGAKIPDACVKAALMPPDPAPAGGAGGGAGCGNQQGGAPNATALAASLPEFKVTVVQDNKCTFCPPDRMAEIIKMKHGGAKITTLDAASEEGKALLKKTGRHALPVYYMDAAVEKDPIFNEMSQFYQKVEGGYIVRTGPNTFTPSVQLERTRIPHHLDLFVEPLSPFTVQMEGELLDLLGQIKSDDLTFSIHFFVQEAVKPDVATAAKSPSSITDVRSASLSEIRSASAGPLVSRRGEEELQESMRQACIFQHAPVGTYFMYLACRNQNIMDSSRGESCLQMTEPIKKCIEGGESEQLLRQDARLGNELGLSSGPAAMWENTYGPFNWHEVDWKTVLEDKKK